jgi:hypothetical protein
MLYDARSVDTGTLPAWLDDGTWTLTDEIIKTTDPGGDSTRYVFKKPFAAGTVTLGGNLQPPATGNLSMYSVVVIPAAVDAGFNQMLTLPSKAQLDGTVGDAELTVTWSQVSGPGHFR